MKWYGKIIFDNEGIHTYKEFDTKEQAEVFVSAFQTAKDISKESDDDPLEDYWTSVDQIEPIED